MKIEIALGLLGALSLFLGWKMQQWKLRCAFLEKSQEDQKNLIENLSREALEKNSLNFLNLASSEVLKPVKEGLSKLEENLRLIEKERRGDHISLKTQFNSLMEAKKELSKETANLVKALRTPLTRGRWGEIQLRRVVEMAGMLNQCDFYEQTSEMSRDERSLRPDLIVRLPGERQIVIDAKVPLEAYLDSVETDDEEYRENRLKEHARLIRAHIGALSKKSYHQQFTPTPEFVVLFLPSENFFSAALQFDPHLIEAGADQGVIIATPTTLIALLRSVAYGWKQENLSKHAEIVSELGHELYKRIVDMTTHFSKMGRSLTSAVEAYNKGMGSLETRVLVSARKFQDMGAAATKLELETPELIEKIPREE